MVWVLFMVKGSQKQLLLEMRSSMILSNGIAGSAPNTLSDNVALKLNWLGSLYFDSISSTLFLHSFCHVALKMIYYVVLKCII